jgi:4-hydroxy-2-oxoheptanedioate aldolase
MGSLLPEYDVRLSHIATSHLTLQYDRVRPTSLRERLSGGGPPAIGTFLKLAGLEPVEAAAAAGFDFAVVDLEHSQLSEAEGRAVLAYARAIGLPALVRVPAVDAGAVNRLLEAGADGIQLSTVTRRSELDALAAATAYAPRGRRSVSLAHRMAGYGGRDLPDYLAEQAEGPLLVGQLETAETDDDLDVLMRARLDVVFIGTVDLSVSMGIPGADIDDPLLAKRIGAIRDAAERAGVALGMHVAPSSVAAASALGARYLTVGADSAVLFSALGELAAQAREAAA